MPNHWEKVNPQENHNPGSLASKELGCTCPEGVNNQGGSAPIPPDGWWINPGCPMHHPQCVLGWLSDT